MRIIFFSRRVLILAPYRLIGFGGVDGLVDSRVVGSGWITNAIGTSVYCSNGWRQFEHIFDANNSVLIFTVYAISLSPLLVEFNKKKNGGLAD